MTIQWYPGHMARARRLIVQELKIADGALEIADARLPLGSRNPELAELSQKPRLLVLAKADLADPACTKEWLQYWNSLGEQAIAVDLLKGTGLKRLRRLVQSSFPQLRRPPRLLVVGVPNVGKSTLINRLIGRRGARVGAKPGITRGKQWLAAPGMQLLDSPGVLWPKIEDQTTAKKLAIIGSIRDEVLDQIELALWLLEFLNLQSAPVLARRYGELDPERLLEDVGRRRGCLLPGNRIDLQQAAALVLKDYRSGKLGALTLEHPPL